MDKQLKKDCNTSGEVGFLLRWAVFLGGFTVHRWRSVDGERYGCACTQVFTLEVKK